MRGSGLRHCWLYNMDALLCERVEYTVAAYFPRDCRR